MESTDYGLPKDQLFFKVADVYNMGLMSREQCKLKLNSGKLKGIKNGQHWQIPRAELIRYINEDMVVTS